MSGVDKPIKNIVIRTGMGHPHTETAFGLVLEVWSPRSPSGVTIVVNGALVEHEPDEADLGEGTKVRDFRVTGITEDSAKLFFSFDGTRAHSVSRNGKIYEIELMNISRRHDGMDYEFMVTESV